MCSASLKKTQTKTTYLLPVKSTFIPLLYYIQWLKWVLQKGTGCLGVHTSMD